MNPELKALLDKYAAAGASDDEMRQVASDWQAKQGGAPAPAAAPGPDTSISWNNLGRSAVQGLTLGSSDEMGLTSRDAQKAFQAAHPIADLGAKVVGGIPTAAAATAGLAAAFPEWGPLALSAAVGGGLGAITGAGEGEGPWNSRSRIMGGLAGGAGGAVLGPLIHGVGLAGMSFGRAVADRINPGRAVARAASSLIDSPAALGAKMDAVNALAPGGASIASSTVGPESGITRFAPLVRGVGANPEAAATVESGLRGQKAALKAGTTSLGAQMDQLGGDLQMTPGLRAALEKAGDVVPAKYMPDVPDKNFQLVNPFNPDEPAKYEPTTVDVQDAKGVLSRLKFMGRQAAKRGVEGNGMTANDINDARGALQDEIYAQRPDFAKLDQGYALLSDQRKQVSGMLKAVERSRGNYAGNEAYGATAGSLGGSLPSSAKNVAMTAIDKILTDRAGAADAVRTLIMQPGGAEKVTKLLAATKPGVVSRILGTIAPPAVRSGLASSTAVGLPTSMVGLLRPADAP